MSLKIFNAYHIKDSAKVWQILADIRERGQREVVERLRAYFIEQVETIDLEGDEYRAARAADLKQGEISLRLDLAEKRLREGAIQSSIGMRRDYFDLDVDVAMTWHETGYYLRGFCDSVSLLAGSLHFLREHPELEDFHFQNQTDAPAEFADREEAWQDRSRIWNEMMTPPGSGMFKDQVVLEISNWKAFWHLNPCFDLRREFHANPPTLPHREEVLARTLRRLSTIREVTAEPGHLAGTAADESTFTVTRTTKRSQKGQWVSLVDGVAKAHPTLNRAVDRVSNRYMEGFVRLLWERYRREAREKKRATQVERR